MNTLSLDIRTSMRGRSVSGYVLVCLLSLHHFASLVHGRPSPVPKNRVQNLPSSPLNYKSHVRHCSRAHDLNGKTDIEGSDQRPRELVELKSQIGSRPPRCQSKCNSCKPCEAVQVPAVPQNRKVTGSIPNMPARGAAGTQEYSNYKPLSWKCRCGDRLFNP